MKRLSSHGSAATETAFTSSSEDCVAKQRMVLTRTMDKWIAENDRTLNTTTWLTYEWLNHGCVHCLKCSVCIRFIEGLKNLHSSDRTCTSEQFCCLKRHRPRI